MYPMRRRKVIRKDDSMTFRLPSADRNAIEQAALLAKRDPSDWVWVVVVKAAADLLNEHAASHPELQRVG